MSVDRFDRFGRNSVHGLSILSLLAVPLSLSVNRPIQAEEPVTLTRLVMRDRIVTIAAASSGLIYSISTETGTVLEQNLRGCFKGSTSSDLDD